MIETREQRKRSTLLHRRKVGIIAFVIAFVILGSSCLVLFNYFNNVLPITDKNGDKYYVKKVDGIFALCNKDGDVMPTKKQPGTESIYYLTTLGSQISVDPETGESKFISIPVLAFEDDGESSQATLLTIFTPTDAKNIGEIHVRNQYDEFTLTRNILELGNPEDITTFYLKDSSVTSLNTDMVASFIYYAGTAYAKSRLKNPLKTSDGKIDYSEYGLEAEKRVDDDGNEYDYQPTKYTLTTLEGEKHTIIMGDRLVTGEGYYCVYENGEGDTAKRRDAIYVIDHVDHGATFGLGSNVESTLLGPAKNLVAPIITYPASKNDYFDVQNFTISKYTGANYSDIVSFSYLSEYYRGNSAEALHPYIFNDLTFGTYRPNHDRIDLLFKRIFLEPEILGIEELGISQAENKNEILTKYGFMKLNEEKTNYVFCSDYMISFKKKIEPQVKYDTEEENQTTTKPSETTDKNLTEEEQLQEDLKAWEEAEKKKIEIVHTIYICKDEETGGYYTYTVIEPTDKQLADKVKDLAIDYISFVSPLTLECLDWDTSEWVYKSQILTNINYTTNIEYVTSKYTSNFKVDLLKVEGTTDSIITAQATNSKNESLNTFAGISVVDTNGILWKITEKKIYAFDPKTGKSLKPEQRRFEFNDLDEQVQVLKNSDGSDVYIRVSSQSEEYAGALIYVHANEIKIVDLDNNVKTILRYNPSIFQHLFAATTCVKIVDSYTFTPEEELALLSDPDNLLVKFKLTASAKVNVAPEGEKPNYQNQDVTNEYAFYKIPGASRKAYITVNGEGGFYVAREEVDDIINNIDKFFAQEK